MADENAQAGGGAEGGAGGAAVIVIKKKKRGEAHGHHGGAWKVAYADFVTAMMAFFLLLWLLAVATDEQKAGIAYYFNPTTNATDKGGGTGIMGGASVMQVSTRAPKDAPVLPPKQSESEDLAQMATEDALFQQVTKEIERAIMNVPELRMLMENLLIDVTPEGLRIQITDSKERPLFENGSAEMKPYTRQIFSILSDVLMNLPNKLALGGHTDVVPYRGEKPAYTNWELSSDRAQSARKVMQEEGMPESKVARVAGYAAQELLLKDEPQAIKNRRIAIIVLRAKKGPMVQFDEKGPVSAIQEGPQIE